MKYKEGITAFVFSRRTETLQSLHTCNFGPQGIHGDHKNQYDHLKSS